VFVVGLVLPKQSLLVQGVRVAVIVIGCCRLCLRLRAALLYVGLHCISLHVSAYMAIFKRVGVFIYFFHMFKDSVSLIFLVRFLFFFTLSHYACFPSVFCSCAVFLRVFWCLLAYAFVCSLFCGHVEKAASEKKQRSRILKHTEINI
jgi:hypothetical protein